MTVSFSGGKDSTAMLLRMIELGEHIDEVIWCDTYKEFPAMYRHVEKVKNVVERAGIKFTVIKAAKDFDYYMFEHQPKRKNLAYYGLSGYSWPGPRMRWCTRAFKLEPFNKYFSELRKQYQIIRCLGIAADEEYRLERENNKGDDKRFPLVEWGWTEKDALQYCYSKGYDWEGLYEIFNRVSCWCCPLQSLSELRKLREHFPDLWNELKVMDRRAHRQFRADCSVEDLEIRFNLEEEY